MVGDAVTEDCVGEAVVALCAAVDVELGPQALINTRSAVKAGFIVPCLTCDPGNGIQVRTASSLAPPAFRHENLLTFLNGEPIALAGRHVDVRRMGYGRRKILWPHTRRHRTRSSRSTLTSSKVARPSGPAKDHVISKMPRVPWTILTRSLAGHFADGSRAIRSAAGENDSRATLRNSSYSSWLRRRMSASNCGVRSNFNDGAMIAVACEERRAP